MRKGEIVRFFRELSKVFDAPAHIILTGAAAGSVYGHIRSTLDIDFSVGIKTQNALARAKLWEDFATAVRQTNQKTGIAAQYAEDIDRWSSITYLDYKRHVLPFAKIGRIRIYILEPSYWAIGKLARYLDPDIRDLVCVLTKTNTGWRGLADVLGRALKESPKSSACFLFKKQVEDFLKTYGRQIWGKNYQPGSALKTFHRAAGIPS